jgi:hypothetical protein
LALGRENVVHIALTDRAAAKRVSDALDRWLHFIGPDTPTGTPQSYDLRGPSSAPCETASQGASAHRSVSDGTEASPAAIVHEEFE